MQARQKMVDNCKDTLFFCMVSATQTYLAVVSVRPYPSIICGAKQIFKNICNSADNGADPEPQPITLPPNT